MDRYEDSSDSAILADLGSRLERRRLDLGLTQAALAAEAGVAKRTVERVESGGSAQLDTLLRILRVLGLLDRVEGLAPAPVVSPIALLKLQGRQRKRASTRSGPNPASVPWTWAPDS